MWGCVSARDCVRFCWCILHACLTAEGTENKEKREREKRERETDSETDRQKDRLKGPETGKKGRQTKRN